MEYGFTIRTKAEASFGVSDPKRINFHSDLTASAALLEFREREKSEIQSTDDFCTEIFAREAREYIRIILAAFRDDKSRQRKANRKNALAFLKIWTNNFRGFGHGQTNTKKHHGGIHLHKLNEAGKVFLKYIKSGKSRLQKSCVRIHRKPCHVCNRGIIQTRKKAAKKFAAFFVP